MRKKKTHEQYENELFQVEANLYPIEQYAGAQVAIKHVCIYDHEVKVTPDNILNKGTGCTYCSGYKKRTTESYIAELKTKNIDYIVMGEYKNTDTPINHKCPRCENVWPSAPKKILSGTNCPKCTHYSRDNSLPTLFYYIKLSNIETGESYYKVGITNKTVKKRYSMEPHIKIEILHEKRYSTGYEAKAVEDHVLNTYKEDRVSAIGFLKNGGNTELFLKDVLEFEKQK